MDLQLHMRFCQSQRDLTYSLHMSSRKIMRRDRSDVHSSPLVARHCMSLVY
jgi:hypothetical protein